MKFLVNSMATASGASCASGLVDGRDMPNHLLTFVTDASTTIARPPHQPMPLHSA